MRIFLVVLTLSLAACGGSGSSSSSKPDSKPQTSGNSSTNAIPQKNALALDKFPVSDLQQVTFQSLDSSSIPAIKTFD
ncbi:hypothetical protein [Bacterioplanoides sp.]|uniref:hypothetical protein n=1 Tax=Bacterioplanoides sp. TaxID=2066072 RepID=UPI003B5C3D74